jgi:hypothetical protein
VYTLDEDQARQLIKKKLRVKLGSHEEHLAM